MSQRAAIPSAKGRISQQQTQAGTSRAKRAKNNAVKPAKPLKGADGFASYYAATFRERWSGLCTALAEPGVYTEIAEPGRTPYYLNRASYLVVQGLGIKQGDHILDLCAAPGGKSLCAALLMGADGNLTANDISANRRRRLQNTLRDSLPPELYAQVRIIGHDGTRWGLYEQNTYDKVILDAPCSSEGHYIQQPKLQEQWSLSRIKRIAITQYALLAAAFAAVRPGGTILYSTCALLPQENDMVVAKLLKRQGDAVEVLPVPGVLTEGTQQAESAVSNAQHATPELTEYGVHYLPDTVPGHGPLYACYIRKRG